MCKMLGYKILACITVLLLLIGCGESAKPKSTDPGTAEPTLTLSLVDKNGKTITTVDANNPATVYAELKDAFGVAVSNAVLSFTTDDTYGKLVPATALTDKYGKASVTLTAASISAAGATTLYAQTKINNVGVDVKGGINYAVQATASPPVTTNAETSLTISLTNATGQSITKITGSSSANVTAILSTASGAPVVNAIVSFDTDSALAKVSPATALTDSQGRATTTLSAASLTAAGASMLRGTALYGSESVNGSIGYAVGAANVTITAPTIGTSPLSAFGTTSVSVTVNSDGVPVTTQQTVTFSSACDSNGTAEITRSVTTVNGVATATYRDNGCASTDMITASASGLATSSGTITVNPPSIGSVQFVSARPNSIGLKGTGGAGRTESAQVVFKVLDSSGNPLGGKTVNFALSTSVGGMALVPSSAISDSKTGEVLVSVNAGTVSTPVRVIATTGTLSTQSDQLTVSTGIPDQRNFSLSAAQHNIEGWNYDGTTTVLTARLADHFGNPVPDGTVVNFVTEGGSISPSCTISDGACNVTWTSQNFRPSNGRVTVLAYAVGEEGFTDLNGDGFADASTEMKDGNGLSTDMPEAFLDNNENGTFDAATEAYFDYNSNKSYDIADGKYNGVLCDATVSSGSTNACSAQKGIHVRGEQVLVFSGSAAQISLFDSDKTTAMASIALPACTPSGNPAKTFYVNIVDIHGNALPVGSMVTFSSDNGSFVSETSYTVADSTGCRSDYVGCPASAGNATFGHIAVMMRSDADSAAGCVNEVSSGLFSVKVKTPRGFETSMSVNITD